jgi:hypothetical protein
MKLTFGRGIVFDVDPKTDYLMDNGACIQICTKDKQKCQQKGYTYIDHYHVPGAGLTG